MKNPGAMRGAHAFTLIELLIVVAIIAILAAIAVPNFLEAQTRSKVSRTLADMRSIATGLESYYVDHNFYPPSRSIPLDPVAKEKYSSYLPRLVHLTTPVSYLTTVFEDVFADTAIQNYANQGASGASVKAYQVPFGSGNFVRPYTFDFAARKEAVYSDQWTYITLFPSAVHWALRSVGPDGIPEVLGSGDAIIYDPTNGTVSLGEIFFTGPGTGVDKPVGPI